jgi:predicted dienelactone hydrolase
VPTKTFGTVDPTMAGPFKVVVKNNIGPENGNPDAKWNNQKPHFNLYLPDPLGQGYCHPVITWSNGTGDQPPTYEVLIKQLASHGFVVVASLSSQTAAGDPIPPIAGVNWMIEENDNPANEFGLYHNLDISKIGATGHSQGGAATTMAGGDPRVVATAPICGSRANITMHGPAILICGGADTMVPCSSVQSAFDSIKTVPVMMAEMAGTTHGSWIGSIKDPVMVATTGWMRVHLMNDTANRNWFYGANCKACTDSKWKIQRKMMDQ